MLLHSRPRELRAIVDAMSGDDRIRFFDELPEEAWRHLMDELSGKDSGHSHGEERRSSVTPAVEGKCLRKVRKKDKKLGITAARRKPIDHRGGRDVSRSYQVEVTVQTVLVHPRKQTNGSARTRPKAA